MNTADRDGRTPLHIASSQGHLSIVEYLINHGADVNKADNDGCTPIMVAKKVWWIRDYASNDIIRMLREHGARE